MFGHYSLTVECLLFDIVGIGCIIVLDCNLFVVQVVLRVEEMTADE